MRCIVKVEWSDIRVIRRTSCQTYVWSDVRVVRCTSGQMYDWSDVRAVNIAPMKVTEVLSLG